MFRQSQAFGRSSIFIVLCGSGVFLKKSMFVKITNFTLFSSTCVIFCLYKSNRYKNVIFECFSFKYIYSNNSRARSQCNFARGVKKRHAEGVIPPCQLDGRGTPSVYKVAIALMMMDEMLYPVGMDVAKFVWFGRGSKIEFT